jgi:hypothetical protein
LEIQQTYNMLINAAAQKGLDQYKAALQIERDKALQARHLIASSNRAIVAEAHCSGKGLFEGGASLDFDIYTDEVFVGSTNDLQQVKSFHLTAIQNAPAPQRVRWSGGVSVFKLEANQWKEYKDGAAIHQFVQEGQDQNFIYMYDNTRNLHLALGIGKGYWKQGGTANWNFWIPGNWG